MGMVSTWSLHVVKKKKKENAEMRELLRGTVKPTGQTSDGTSGH
jgi:hypothetical protein